MNGIKRVVSILLLTAMIFSIVITGTGAIGLESEQSNAPDLKDPRRLEEIEKTNAEIDAYLANKVSPNASSGKTLSVPLYQQINSYYCGPASVQMVIKYVTGSYIAQSTLASSMGTSQNGGTYVYRISNELNSRIGSGSYQYLGTLEYSFGSSLIYSIDKNKPVICHVMTGGLPNYKNGSNTGHYVVAIGYVAGFSGSTSVATCTYNDPHYNDAYFGQHTCGTSVMADAIDANYGYYIRGT